MISVIRTLTGRCILLAALCLLALATSASAECAWVLWVDDSQDSPLGSFATKGECEARKQQLMASQRKDLYSQRLNCYPDTMDPRPKGWHAMLMTIRDFVEGPQMMTIAILIGGVGASYWASRSGRRSWLWFIVGMFVTATVFGVVRGVVGGLSQ